MSDEIDREITTKRVSSNPNNSVDGYSVSEQRTTRANNDNSAVGLIIGVLLTLGLGGGAVIYYLNNNRPAPAQIVVPGPSNTVREKSTTVENNNTTTKEVEPAKQQPTPNVEINVPAPAATTQPVPPVPTPAATTQPQTATPAATPSPAN